MSIGCAIKTGFFLKDHWKQILCVLFVFLFLPLIIACSFSVTSSIPGVEEDEIRLYIETVDEVSKGKVQVDFKDVIAIHAVTFKQNFKKVKKSDIESLANKFIKTVKHTSTDKDGKKHTTTTYELKTLDEVCKELNLSDDEIQQVQNYRKGLDVLNGTGAEGGYEIGDIGEVKASLSQKEFIDKIAEGAIENYKQYKVFPSICISQAILESGWGRSGLTKRANNLFGIKAYSWSGPYVEMRTAEYNADDSVYYIMAKFRAYPTWKDSVLDHGNFLKVNSTYRKHGVFDASDYIQQAYALRAAGYATSPEYPMQLITLIKQYGLDKYDKQ